MKKIALLIFFTSLALISVGCEQHRRFMDEPPTSDVFDQMTPSAASEVALAESVAAKRLAYRAELEKIKSFYEQSGNQLKIEWVDRELKFLDDTPRYRYILQAEVAGSDLRARDIIPKADGVYKEALGNYKRSNLIFPIPMLVEHRDVAFPHHVPIYVSKKRLQRALNGFNEVIENYPTSDKIDDAAYYAGRIHEYFGDYSIAVLYYKRAFQWDSATPYPARYSAAKLLDNQLVQRDEALELYRESLDREDVYHNSNAAIEQRIRQLTGGDPNDMPLE
ncbi:MAG: hypothetical protein A2Y10_09495 [Planctomycetes bacterium GWF2_41_51]|nr:MAG: hypothetical protein A2Y10_09495 [Planctomycetes bacterium GWF2_41_51]